MIILANAESDHIMHIFTIYSVLLVLIGFLFVSYEFLEHPEGLLRLLIRIIVPSLVIIIFFSFLASWIPSSFLLGPFKLRDIIASFTLYGSLIAMFYGLFTHAYDVREKSPPQQQASNTPALSGNKIYCSIMIII